MKADRISGEMQLYHVKLLLSRAIATAVRTLLNSNKMERPKIISAEIKDKQNVSTIGTRTVFIISRLDAVYTSICSVNAC